MKKIAWLILLLALAAPACTGPGKGAGKSPANNGSSYKDIPMPRFSTPVTREELRYAYYRYSAPSIVWALTDNNEVNWDYVFDKVVSGDADWIRDFVTYVAPGTDASTGEGVPIALAYALPNNPDAVLSLYEEPLGYSLRKICTLPFIEPEYEFIQDYGEKTLAALKNVHNPDLIEKRDVCITNLKDSLIYCDKIYKEGKWTY